MKKDLLSNVVLKGFTAALAGIIGGFVLGLLIWTLSQLASVYSGNSMQDYHGIPLEAITTMGMMVGGFLGGIFGAITGLKEK